MTNAALLGKPDAGNPHVRFDEGEVASATTPRRGSLLYKNIVQKNIAVLVAITLAVAAHCGIIDSDTLVYVSSDIAPASGVNMNDLSVSDPLKPALQFTNNTRPMQISDVVFSNLYAGIYYDSCKTANTNVLYINGRMGLKMADNSYLNDSFTAEFFFRAESADSTGMFSPEADAYLAMQHANWYFRINSSGVIFYNDSTGDTRTDTKTSEGSWHKSSYIDGQWHHFAVVWDRQTSMLRAYIDYKLFKASDLSGKQLPRTTSNDASLFFGRGCWGENHQLLKGRYDSIRITQRSLAPAEFLSAGVLPIDADTLAYMHFDSNVLDPCKDCLGVKALSSKQRSKGAPNYGWQTCDKAADIFYPVARSLECKVNEGAVTNYFESANANSGFGYSFADPNHLVGTTNFTAEVIAKFTRADSQYYGYLFMQQNVWRLFLDRQGNLGCSIYGTETNYVGNVSLIDDRWHHISVVYDMARKIFSFYLDYRLFWRFENVDNPMKDGAANPEMLLFGGSTAVDTWDIIGSVPGVLYDELRITGRALKVTEFLTDISIAGKDPLFFARYENDYSGMSDGRYAVTGVVSASGVRLSRSARASEEIRNAVGETVFLNVSGVALSGGTATYLGNGVLDLRATTTEFFIKVDEGCYADSAITFFAEGVVSPIWKLSADGAFVFNSAEDSMSTTLAAISDRKLHHVAVVHASSGADTHVSVYLDHALVAEDTISGLVDFGLGAGFTLGSPGFSGALDEMRIREGSFGIDDMLYCAPPLGIMLIVF